MQPGDEEEEVGGGVPEAQESEGAESDNSSGSGSNGEHTHSPMETLAE